MPSTERSPQERETLIFPDPETAQRFKEGVTERLARQPNAGKENKRAAVAEAVAQQFAQAGEGVELVREPWLHTPTEHAEAQQLVDVAFARDLGAAIKMARNSPHYPRNLDLFHDVLTGEMYDLMTQEKLNRQSLVGWLVALALFVLVVAAAATAMWFLAR